MKISKDSWHFKLTNVLVYGDNLYRKVHYGTVSLCPYFWAVVWSTFLAGVIFPFAAAGLVYAAVWPLWWWLAEWGSDNFLFAVIAGIVDIFILSGIWVIYRQANYGTFWPQRVSKVAKKVCKKKRKSVLYHWFKAKHDKICPYLELDNE